MPATQADPHHRPLFHLLQYYVQPAEGDGAKLKYPDSVGIFLYVDNFLDKALIRLEY